MFKLLITFILLNAIIEFSQADIDESFIVELKRNKQIIYLNEKSSNTIRLKSVLSLNKENLLTTSNNNKINAKPKILWQFRRIYSMPNYFNPQGDANKQTGNAVYKVASNSSHTMPVVTSNFELSQLEIMISLGAEVESNLEQKYSIDFDETSSNAGNYDLIIKNLTHADSGLYMCNLWNQKAIYYQLIVSSKC